jgi:hypothetical protein
MLSTLYELYDSKQHILVYELTLFQLYNLTHGNELYKKATQVLRGQTDHTHITHQMASSPVITRAK